MFDQNKRCSNLEGSNNSNDSVLLITNGKLVLENEVVTGSLAITNHIIEQIILDDSRLNYWKLENPQAHIIDADGRYVLPGLIDIHCDTIEKEVEPRPNTIFPLQMALIEFEKKLAASGITTMYHSLSLGVGLSLRGENLLTQMVATILDYRKKRSLIRNKIHLRYEVSHLQGLAIVERYLQEHAIDMISLMDHSPGQGQYRAEGSFERYVMKNQGIDIHEVADIVKELEERRTLVDWNNINRLTSLAKEKNIAIASHDDDSTEQVDLSIARNASISEFPIQLETAIYATSRQMKVCVGAPNIVRGGSHDKNLSAAEAVKAGAAHIICSDYHPSSLLASLFKLVKDRIVDLPTAVCMATLNPAAALQTEHQTGSIAPGKYADLLLVDQFEGMPIVSTTIVGGSIVYHSAARRQKSMQSV